LNFKCLYHYPLVPEVPAQHGSWQQLQVPELPAQHGSWQQLQVPELPAQHGSRQQLQVSCVPLLQVCCTASRLIIIFHLESREWL
jgi:hypothetical protein